LGANGAAGGPTAKIAAHAANAAAHAWHTFAPGARVFDHESGQDGTVLKSAAVYTLVPAPRQSADGAAGGLFKLPNSITSERVSVRLDDGAAVDRDAAELVGLPAGLDSVPAEIIPPGLK